MTRKELKQIRDALLELSPNIETHSWGPTYELAQIQKHQALAIIKRELKATKNEKLLANMGQGPRTKGR